MRPWKTTFPWESRFWKCRHQRTGVTSVKGPCILQSPAARGRARCKALETWGTSFRALRVCSEYFVAFRDTPAALPLKTASLVAWLNFLLLLTLLSSKCLAKMEQIKMKRQCSSLQIIFLFHIKRSHSCLWALRTAEGDSKFYVMGGKRGLAFSKTYFDLKKENVSSFHLQKHIVTQTKITYENPCLGWKDTFNWEFPWLGHYSLPAPATLQWRYPLVWSPPANRTPRVHMEM